MSQTIKDKVKNQIQIHQQLVNYYDSDSDQFEQSQSKLSDMPKSSMCNHIDSDDSDTKQHEKMNQRRKQILNNLQFSSKQNIVSQQPKQQRSLKLKNPNQVPSQEQNKQIFQLKSKIAQLIKQSQQKSSKMTELETQITVMTIKVASLKQEIQQKSATINQKQERISSLTLQNQNISQNYCKSLNQYEKQYNRRTDSLHNEVTQINQSTMEKDKQIDILTSLVKLKDRELQQLKLKDQNSQKCIAQNSRLKADLNRLISLLQTTLKNQRISKSSKNILEGQLLSFKPKKQRSKSFAIENVFLQYKFKTPKHLSSCFDVQYSSLPSKGSQHKKSQPDWFPTDLINKVESFLKKSRIAQNNKNFINSLVSFILSYTEKCVNQAKSKMENRYRSLKKEIYRKANQSLVLGEVMKERELKIKLNKSQNKTFIGKSPVKVNQTKIQDLNLTSQNVSILVPASNKKLKESRKNNFCFGSMLLDKTQKDDIGYMNLEQSIKIHRQNSAHAFDPQLNVSNKIVDSLILQTGPCLKDKKKHYRTESSVKSSKKQYINSSNKKRSVKSVGLKNSFDFPLKRFKII